MLRVFFAGGKSWVDPESKDRYRVRFSKELVRAMEINERKRRVYTPDC